MGMLNPGQVQAPGAQISLASGSPSPLSLPFSLPVETRSEVHRSTSLLRWRAGLAFPYYPTFGWSSCFLKLLDF